MTSLLNSKSYPYKHWLTSIALAPTFPILYNIAFLHGENYLDYLKGYPAFFLYGLLSSLPAFAIYLLLFSYLAKGAYSELIIKTLLNLATITCIFLTFLILGGSEENDIAIMYSVSVLITSFFYKIKSKPPK